MLGALFGDIAGSRFEFDNIKSKDFELLNALCSPTDDSIMSLAVAQGILEAGSDMQRLPECAVQSMRSWGRAYPDPTGSYGGGFFRWLVSRNPMPYNSFGNGSAMRVSACGWAGGTLQEVIGMSGAVTAVTHNHPEGMKGAEATAVCIWLARTGKSRQEIRDHIDKYYYSMDFSLDGIRPSYAFDVTCQGSVPQAIEAFLEAEDFEDAIRNAISIGGDSDTIAAITGGIAEAYFGIPDDLRKRVLPFLDEHMLKVLTAFEAKYPPVAGAAKM